jgi:hypothetical protein
MQLSVDGTLSSFINAARFASMKAVEVYGQPFDRTL